jgi:O-acetyl-ADP-ribose deacetylase (regulator of RNase III)
MNVNIPISSELYDRVRFSGYKYTKDGYTATINGNVSIEISKADITKENVDIIVSVTNSQLNHDGGLAKVIRKAGAGKAVKEECTEYVQTKGPVMTGNVVMTSAGDLPAKKIIHAVGPVHE